ncbi:clavesin-1-like [Anticarsia gemmatalis]|uniref:clavesin-1-like n=1 Tax=Anticarsia gemmatalis TaxID=129554 RepID=UPI003F762746
MNGIVKPITIEREYEKNPDISPEDIRKLREWLKTQPHLPGEHLTDVDLLIVYHCCDKSMEVSKQVMDLHYTLRTMFTQFFKDRCFDKKADFSMNTVLYAPLPTKTLQGDRAVYLRLLDPDPKNFYFVEAVRAFMMMFDMWQYEEGTFQGFVMMIDMDSTSLSHVTRLDIMAVKKVLYFLQECMLTKLKGLHFLSAPYFMDKLMMLLKPFLTKQLMDMLHIHQVGSDSIYSIVPKEAFPKEEGGSYKDHNTIRDELIHRMQANSTFLREENRRRVNEALRPGGKPSQVEKEFGMQGSFKKLDID